MNTQQNPSFQTLPILHSGGRVSLVRSGGSFFMTDKESPEHYYEIILGAKYRFNDTYGLTYLTESRYEILSCALSELRALKEIDLCFHSVAKEIFKHHLRNYYKIKELDRMQPRLIAQKFIGKRNIRQFIFKRDGNKCLKCGLCDRFEIDHIMPRSKGGLNMLSNLQTLCKSCNVKKRDNYKDYRNGTR